MKSEYLKWIIMGVVALVVGVGTGILSFKYRKEIGHGVSVVYNNVSKRINFPTTLETKLKKSHDELREKFNSMVDAKFSAEEIKLKNQLAKIEELQKEHAERRRELEMNEAAQNRNRAELDQLYKERGTPEEFNEWMDNISKLGKATDQCRLMKERHNMVMNSLSDPFNNIYTEEQRAANIEKINSDYEKAQKDFEEINAKCEAYTKKYNIKGRPRDKDRNIVQEEPGNFVVNVDELNSRKISEI